MYIYDIRNTLVKENRYSQSNPIVLFGIKICLYIKLDKF